MPTVRCSPLKQAANLQRRASEITIKENKKIVNVAMKLHPWVVQELITQLQSMQIVTLNDEGEKVVKQRCESQELALPSFQAMALRRRIASKGPLALTPNGNGPDFPQPPVDEDLIPTRYNTIDTLSTAGVQRLLTFAEPGILSKNNLKAIVRRGDALMTQQEHTKMVEFISGVAGHFKPVGPYRYWSTLERAINEKNVARGRRAQDIVLPDEFSKKGNGIYDWDVVVKAVVVTHRALKITKKFAQKDLPTHKTLSDIFIDFNESEMRASIASKSDCLRTGDLLLLHYFPKQTVVDEITQPMITDGAVDEGTTEEAVVSTPAKVMRKKKRAGASGFVAKLAKRAKHTSN